MRFSAPLRSNFEIRSLAFDVDVTMIDRVRLGVEIVVAGQGRAELYEHWFKRICYGICELAIFLLIKFF